MNIEQTLKKKERSATLDLLDGIGVRRFGVVRESGALVTGKLDVTSGVDQEHQAPDDACMFPWL